MKQYAFGIDIGGTTVKCGFFKNDGTFVEKWEIPTRKDNGGDLILPDIADAIRERLEKHGVSMTEIALAWLLTKVDSPVVGATKLHHIEGAAKAVDCVLTGDEIACLEEPYVPHPLAGVMAQNKRENAKQKHVWSTGDQTIREE